MISVEEAQKRIFDLVTPLDQEIVGLRNAAGRILAAPVVASAAQPPFAASVMDGYAICDHASAGDRFEVIGESAAGGRFDGTLSNGQAVRIFTGAPVPDGAIRIVIQEDVDRDGDVVTLRESADDATYIRPVGADFSAGDTVRPPFVITPSHVAMFAAMNCPEVAVARRPEVAIIATGDELVAPGETPDSNQIIASNSLGLAAMLEAGGAIPRLLPIARDTTESLNTAFDLAQGSDLVITIGGASVGDHDLVAKVAAQRGAKMALHKVAMRPGKPLMAGTLAGTPMIGLPGNPVSAMVCGHVFILPVIRRLQGLPAEPAPRHRAILTKPMPENGPREHYLRARRDGDTVAPFDRQDSALLSVLATANALIVRPPHASAVPTGAAVDLVNL